MELSYTTPTPTLYHFRPSPPPPSFSFLSLSGKNPFAQPKKELSFFTSVRNVSPSSFSLQFSFHPWTSFVTSAARGAVDTVEDKLPADLLVTETLEPNSRVRLSVDVPPVVCEDCYRRVIREFTKHAKVPGFRPGKNIPESILVSYVGRQNVQKATIESILERTLPHALSSVTGKALEDSIHIATKFSDMEKIYLSLNSLRYEVIVEVAPVIKWVPEDAYKNLKVTVELDSDVDAQRIAQQELKRRHKSLGVLKIVADRGLQVGDVAVLDISAMTIEQDESNAKRIPAAESKGFNFDTEEGDKVLPGFLDSIIGIKYGETKSFPLIFPESWKQEDLRGVHAQFTASSFPFIVVNRP